MTHTYWHNSNTMTTVPHIIIFTKPAPVRLHDRAEGVPLNVLAHVAEGVSYRAAVSQARSWAINKLSTPEYDRLINMLNALACTDTFQVGQYSVHVRQL